MLTQEMKDQLQKVCGTVLFDEPLAHHTSIRIGGPADVLSYPKTIEEVSSLIQFSRKNHLPVFVLGAGTNILVRDKGIRGVVINLSQGFNQIRLDSPTTLYVEAGVGLPRLVEFAAEEGLTGIEGLAGIPGNVGGALVMNAGTLEGEIADAVETVTFLTKEAKLETWTKEKIRFSYRESHFSKGAILLSTRLNLSRMASELIRGRLQKQRDYRLETQPLNVPNLGSVFKNIKEKKIFAGRLVEEAGLKDVRVGGARISPKHGNWIINEGGAKAKEVLALIGLVRDKVKEKFGVLLETEVRVVGEE